MNVDGCDYSGVHGRMGVKSVWSTVALRLLQFLRRRQHNTKLQSILRTFFSLRCAVFFTM